jgi:adenylate kinase
LFPHYTLEAFGAGFSFYLNFQYNKGMKLQNVIVFMGAPGSGKGTQTKLLASKLGYEFFSTGELSRQYAKQDTEFGRRVKSIIDQGIILPIDIIREIFIKKFETLADASGVILDGYPRTVEQAHLLQDLINKYNIKNFSVIFLEVDKTKLLKRLEGRQNSGRADDDPAVIEKRFDEYITKTAPVKEHYESKGLLTTINGDRLIEDVHKDILNKI